MLRYISIIDILIVGLMVYAWFFPRKVLSGKDIKGTRLSEEKIALWLPRVRPILLGLLALLIVSRIAMYHFFPRFADLNSSTWGLAP